MKINPLGKCLMNHRILRIKDKLPRVRFQIFRLLRANLSLSLMRVVRVWRVKIVRSVTNFIRMKIIIMIRRGLVIFKKGLFLSLVCKALIVCFIPIIIYWFNNKIHTPTLVRQTIFKKWQTNHPHPN
jgi:hypothetical protein